MNTRPTAPRLRRRPDSIADQVITEMMGRVLPKNQETPDSSENPDVPRLDVCAFNSSI